MGKGCAFLKGSIAGNVCVAATKQSHLDVFSEEMVQDVMDDNAKFHILPMTVTFLLSESY